jgi:hypothetical protein
LLLVPCWATTWAGLLGCCGKTGEPLSLFSFSFSVLFSVFYFHV